MIIRALLLAGLAAIGWLVFLRRNKLPFHLVLMLLLLGVGAGAVLAPEDTLDAIAQTFGVGAGAVLAPEDTLDAIAQTFGVGRGVDLITYLFEVAALFVLLHYYTKFVDLQRQLTQVTRELAIMKAEVEKLEASRRGE